MTKLQQYMEWSNKHAEDFNCLTTSNPAYTDSHASRIELFEALSTCDSCPVLNECKAWSKTSVFKQFDGVMGGRVLHDASEETSLSA